MSVHRCRLSWAPTDMRPQIVGCGSSGRAPPNTVTACFEAIDGGADSVAVDVCETADGMLVVANRRTLRLLHPTGLAVPTFEVVSCTPLDGVFGPHASRHRVAPLDTFLAEIGGLSLHVRIDGAIRPEAWRAFESTLFARESGPTTVLGTPRRIVDWRVPSHVQRVALIEGADDLYDAVAGHVDGVAASARSLSTLGRVRLPLLALDCDTRSALVMAREVRAVAVLTERPAWLRCVWDERSFAPD